MPTDRPMTNGEYLVGRDFNPSNNIAVDDIKAVAATLIDQIDWHMKDTGQADNPDAARCAAIAKTEIESAAMWAVKAVTKRPRP